MKKAKRDMHRGIGVERRGKEPQMQRMNERAATGLDREYGNGGALLRWSSGSARHLAEVAHDARNMVTALGLYCELLEEPGVLSPAFLHYGGELRLLASASRNLVDKLMALHAEPGEMNSSSTPGQSVGVWEGALQGRIPTASFEPLSGTLIQDLAFEIETNRNLLNALAGTGIDMTMEIAGGHLPVGISSEDLTRILVNLVRNAVEAMPGGGRLHLTLRELPIGPGSDPMLVLSVEDNGPGVSPDILETIFEPGFTTRGKSPTGRGWHGDHLGLGLSITRSIVEAAGGRIRAARRDPAGACFQIELPVRVS